MEQKIFKFSNQEILISKEGIKFVDSWGTNDIKDLLAFRYGTKFVEIQTFSIGRIYTIELLTESNEKISIPLKSYFGINKKKLWNDYNLIIDSLWECFFNDIYGNNIDDYNNGINLTFDDRYQVTDEGLLILRNKELIKFEEINIIESQDYFSVNSKSNPKVYTNVYYLEVWNSMILFSILKTIISE